MLPLIKGTSRTNEKERSLEELSDTISRFRNLLKSVAAEGGIPLLVELVDRGSSKAKEQAVGLLRRLAELSQGYVCCL